MLTGKDDIDNIIKELLKEVRSILEDSFIGIYIGGSLAYGDFNPESSDVDLYVVIKNYLTQDQFKNLELLYKKLYSENKKTTFEASYIPIDDLYHFDPLKNRAYSLYGNLRMEPYESSFLVEIFVLQNNGIVIEGPDFKSISKVVTVDELKKGTFNNLDEYWVGMIDSPKLEQAIYQEFAVVTMCRTLYTIKFGEVASKPKALKWAREEYGEYWADLIEFAINWKHGNQFNKLDKVKEFIRFTIKEAKL